MLVFESWVAVSLRSGDKLVKKERCVFFKAWGKPPKHTHIFSPESLAMQMKSAGFAIGQAKLIGNRSKAVFLIGRKV